MTERPILFSGPMVRAILDGRKTQTRRVVKVPKHIKPDGLKPMKWERHDASLREQGVSDNARPYLTGPRWEGEALFGNLYGDPGYGVIECPYGQPGDRLWVRETWCYATDSFAVTVGAGYKADGAVVLRGDLPLSTIPDGSQVFNGHAEKWPTNVTRWRPSIHMPRWASRLTPEITDVRVERLQDISRADAKAEGFLPSPGNGLEFSNGRAFGNANLAFRDTWDSLNAKRGFGWDVNPLVWVIEFRRLP